MGKASELGDDIAVADGEADAFFDVGYLVRGLLDASELIVPGGVECDAAVLDGKFFAVHEGHVEEVAVGEDGLFVAALVDGIEGDSKALCVGGVHGWGAAKHVAGELVDDDDVGNESVGCIEPVFFLAGDDGVVKWLKSHSDFAIEVGVFHAPAFGGFWCGGAVAVEFLEPEVEHVLDCFGEFLGCHFDCSSWARIRSSR